LIIFSVFYECSLFTQQQLSLGQQQTLLFMTNSTANGTRINRRVRRPFVTLASVQAKQGINGRTKLTIKAMQNAQIKIRKQRDLEEYDPQDLDPNEEQVL